MKTLCPSGVQQVHEESFYSVIKRVAESELVEVVFSGPSAEDSSAHVCAEGAGGFFLTQPNDSENVVLNDGIGNLQE